MNAFTTAAEVYRREPCARTLREDLEAHLVHGWVFSTPELFLMGRVVRHDWPEDRILDPWDTDEAGDCWHVWLCSGDILEALAMMPFPLPWVSYQRRNVLRVVEAGRLLRWGRSQLSGGHRVPSWNSAAHTSTRP